MQQSADIANKVAAIKHNKSTNLDAQIVNSTKSLRRNNEKPVFKEIGHEDKSDDKDEKILKCDDSELQ